MEKEYIVGIDFGHGETSAWFVPIQGNSAGEALRIRNAAHANESVCPSWVYRDENYNYSLVQTAGSFIRHGFKAKPVALDEDPEQKAAFAAYIKLIIQELLQNNDKLMIDSYGDSNFILCVACPTRWSEDDKRLYLSFLSNSMLGTKVQPMWIINESDAAFFSWVGSPDDSYKVGTNDCTLVIDYGSSTIDYTMMMDGKKVSDDSWSNPELGASLVEFGIVEDYKNKNFDTYQRFFEKTIYECVRTGKSRYNANEIESYLIADTRKAKEGVFIQGTWPNMNRMVFSMFERCGGYASGYNDNCDLKISGSLLDFPLLMKYQNDVKADFEKLKQYIDNKVGINHLKHIILSGGACLMTWVRPMVLQVFGQDINVHMDNAPAYVVSKGIAYYAKAQLSALNKLREEVSRIDFCVMYKEADRAATANTIEKLSYKLKSAIDNLSGPNAYDINREFRDFLARHLGMEGSNKEEYCEIFRKEFNQRMNAKVYEKLGEIVKECFGKSVVGSGNVDYEPTFTFFKQEQFDEGGSFYSNIYHWIEQAAVSAGITLTTLFFDHSRARYGSEKDALVNGTKSKLIDFFRSDVDSITYYQGVLEDISDKLKKRVLELSEQLFYEQQLFRTTFVK